MRKWLLVIIGIILVGCCASNEYNPDNGVLIKKIHLQYHHSENCTGHQSTLEKIVFEDEGHTMWLYWINSSIAIIDSPDCQICHPKKPESILEETPKSDYWGW